MDTRALIVLALVGCGDAAVATEVVDASTVDSFEPTPPSGLVAWFTFQKTTGDASGNGFTVAFGGLLSTAFGPGYIRDGAYMDGYQQYALVDTNDGPQKKLDFPGPFTLAMWVRPERTPTDFEVIASRSFGTADESSFALVLDSALHLRYDSQGGGSVVSDHAIELGKWTHVAITFDGTMKRIYIGGALEATETAPVPVTWDHQYIFMGADEGTSALKASHRLLGTLDEAMFFDRELTQAELGAMSR